MLSQSGAFYVIICSSCSFDFKGCHFGLVFRKIILRYSVLLSHSDVTCSEELKLVHLNISSRIFKDFKYPAPKFVLQTSKLLVGKVWFPPSVTFYKFRLIRTELVGNLLKNYR